MRVVGRFLTRRQGAPAWMRGQFAEAFDRVAPTQPASTAPCTARFARAASWVAERCAGGRRWPGRSTHPPRWPAPAPATARANQPVAAGQFPVECGGWCATLDENRLFPLANQGGVQPLHSHHPMKPDASRRQVVVSLVVAPTMLRGRCSFFVTLKRLCELRRPSCDL
jgi:hypothetical protein